MNVGCFEEFGQCSYDEFVSFRLSGLAILLPAVRSPRETHSNLSVLRV